MVEINTYDLHSPGQRSREAGETHMLQETRPPHTTWWVYRVGSLAASFPRQIPDVYYHLWLLAVSVQTTGHQHLGQNGMVSITEPQFKGILSKSEDFMPVTSYKLIEVYELVWWTNGRQWGSAYYLQIIEWLLWWTCGYWWGIHTCCLPFSDNIEGERHCLVVIQSSEALHRDTQIIITRSYKQIWDVAEKIEDPSCCCRCIRCQHNYSQVNFLFFMGTRLIT